MSSIVRDYDRIVSKLPTGTRIPALYARRPNGQCKYTLSALMLIYFAKHLGCVVKKSDLIMFLRKHRCNSYDPQPRHMGMQWGLHFLVQGSWHPRARRILKAGEYSLMALCKVRQAVIHRSKNIPLKRFEDLRAAYANRCSVCGSQNGQPHLKNPRVLTQLQRGHCDPTKPLDEGNCIPICMMCNRVYKNRAVFTKNGFIKKMLPSS